MLSIDNVLAPSSISVSTNLNVKGLSTFLDFSHSLFGYDCLSSSSYDHAVAGVTYKIGDVQFMADASSMGRKLNSFDIGLLAKAFSLLYGKDALGKDKVSVSVHYQF